MTGILVRPATAADAAPVADLIALDVASTNAGALRFYEREGFIARRERRADAKPRLTPPIRMERLTRG